MTAGWWVFGAWDVRRAAADASTPGPQEGAEAQVAALFEQMTRWGEQVAALPQLQAGLQGDAEPLVEALAALHVPDRLALEVYTPAPDLVAWTGPAMPLGAPVGSVRFLRAPQAALVQDSDARSALVLWMPLREAGDLVGAVRVVRVVRQRVPVQNRYLRSYDAASGWEARITWGGASSASVGASGQMLRGPDGTVVGVVTGVREGDAQGEAVATAERRRRSVLAFWATLLVIWGVAGVWNGNGALAARAQTWSGAQVLLAVAGLVAARYALLVLDVPARWYPAGSSAPAWFSPRVLASGFGGGLARSVADLVLTSGFALLIGAVLMRDALRYRWPSAQPRAGRWSGAGADAVHGLLLGALAMGAASGCAALVRAAVFDATLPYFDPGGSLVDPLVLSVLGALLGVAAAVVLATAAGWSFVADGRPEPALIGVGVGAVGVFALPAVRAAVPLSTGLSLVGLGVLVGWMLRRSPRRWATFVTLRGLVLAVLVLAAVLYPAFSRATASLQRQQMEEGIELFADGRDGRVVFALEQVLRDARSDEGLRAELAPATSDLDSLAADLITGSLLAALDDYSVSLTLRDERGALLGAFAEEPPPGEPPATENGITFGALVRYHAEQGRPASAVPPMQSTGRAGLFRYAGIAALGQNAWAVARAEPRSPRYLAGTPFPQALVPTALVEESATGFSYAAYTGGTLSRSRGAEPSVFRLGADLQTLARNEQRWRAEASDAGPMLALYRRSAVTGEVVVVRARRPVLFDRLYALLRLALGGAVVGALVFGVGAVLRWRAGLLPSPRVRFRDKVLDRFLVVGVLAVGLTGAVGQRVIESQNRAGVEERLRRQLQSVESALRETVRTPQSDLQGSMVRQTPLPLERSLERARTDLVSAQLGLDVNLYRGAELVGSSRSQLVRQRLIERRMPARVYAALFVDGHRYAFAEEQIGTYAYTTGYKALVDGRGQVVGAVAVPTLPEQAARDAEQAQMVAYLFGALLVLLVVVFLTATLLATQLTRPFARLREGLRAVGEGTDVAPIPVDTPDEVGELVETFNQMQQQLAESRRQLAAQERELAWREMARQVAHEIKNPLTPMKLSVQHLGRAYQKARATTPADPKFSDLFDRVTATLEEQIDALARIAGAFSSFGRLPQQRLETVDLSEVVEEAARLVEAEAASVEAGPRAPFRLALHPHPLLVQADREELRRVFINLFKNAFQALPGGAGRIDAQTFSHQGRAVATVRDTGTGIPADVQARIFEPRFSTKTSGMGLGLAITKKAIEDLRGQIHFTTEEGAGTTFEVTLPLATEAAE